MSNRNRKEIYFYKSECVFTNKAETHKLVLNLGSGMWHTFYFPMLEDRNDKVYKVRWWKSSNFIEPQPFPCIIKFHSHSYIDINHLSKNKNDIWFCLLALW